MSKSRLYVLIAFLKETSRSWRWKSLWVPLRARVVSLTQDRSLNNIFYIFHKFELKILPIIKHWCVLSWYSPRKICLSDKGSSFEVKRKMWASSRKSKTLSISMFQIYNIYNILKWKVKIKWVYKKTLDFLKDIQINIPRKITP